MNKKIILIIGGIFVMVALVYVLVSAYTTGGNPVISSSQKGLVAYWALDAEGYNSNTKRITDKTAYENHGTRYSNEELVTNGDAETGDTSNWNLDGVDTTDYHSGVYSFYEQGAKTVTSEEFIPIDLNKKYNLEGWFKSNGTGGQSRLYFGFVPYDENKVRIGNEHVNVRLNTETTLYEDCDASDKVVKIVNGSNWATWTSARMAFDIDDSGNYSDLPNRELSNINIINLTDKGSYWEVEFNTNVGKTYSAGTKVREHWDGGSYMYVAASGALVPTSWTPYVDSSGIEGESLYGTGYDKWWRGTSYVRILMLANYGQSTDYKLKIDDISLHSIPSTFPGVTLTSDRMGQSDRAMSFDDVDYIAGFDGFLVGQTELSISAWVNPSSLTYIFQHGSSGSHNGYLNYFRVDADGSLTIDVQHAATGHFTPSSNNGEVGMNEWSHVGVIVDNDSVDFYVNGEMIDSNSFSGMYALATSSAVYRNIGRYYYNSDTITYSTGNLSDVKIYNRAISADEMDTLYHSYESKTSASSLQKGLVGHWVLDAEGYNSNTERITDKTAYENHGTNSGATLTSDRMGKSGGAMEFDGSGTVDGVTPGDNVVITESITNTDNYPDGCTYDVWLYVDPDAVDRMSLFWGAGTIRHIEIYSSGKYFRTEAALQNGYSFGTGNFPDDVRGVWSHFVIVFANNETNRPVRWYQNGNLFHTGTMDGGTYPGTEYFSFSRIGRSTGSVSYLYAKSFDGKISDVHIYNRALSVDEIDTLYHSYRPKASAGSLQKSLVLDMPLKSTYLKDETIGSEIITDRTPYSNDGQNYGATIGSEYMSFDGNTEYAEIQSSDTLNPDSDNLSITMWFKAAIIGTLNSEIIYNKESLYEASAGGGYFTYAWQPYWAWTGGTSFPINVGEWYFAVVVYDGINQYVYKNGVQVYSREQSGNMGTNTNDLRIGARGSPAAAGSFFQGDIANTRIYNRALSVQEIKLLYDKGR